MGLLSDMAKRYEKFANRKFDTHFTVEDSCNGCGICAKVCPVANIAVNERPEYRHHCISCLSYARIIARKTRIRDKGEKSRTRFRHEAVSLKGNHRRQLRLINPGAHCAAKNLPENRREDSGVYAGPFSAGLLLRAVIAGKARGHAFAPAAMVIAAISPSRQPDAALRRTTGSAGTGSSASLKISNRLRPQALALFPQKENPCCSGGVVEQQGQKGFLEGYNALFERFMTKPPVIAFKALVSQTLCCGLFIFCRWNNYPVTDKFIIGPARRHRALLVRSLQRLDRAYNLVHITSDFLRIVHDQTHLAIAVDNEHCAHGIGALAGMQHCPASWQWHRSRPESEIQFWTSRAFFDPTAPT
jgi:ferredoxin